MDLLGVKTWFEGCVNATKHKNPFWVIRKGTKIVFSNYTEKDLKTSWELLEMMVNEQARNGARSLEIICKSSSTDPKAKYWTLEIPYGYSVRSTNSPNQAPATISGYGTGGASIGEIQRLQEEKFNQQLTIIEERAARELADFKRDVETKQQMKELQEEIQAVKETQKNGFEKFMDLIDQHSEVCTPIIQGVMSSMFPKVQIAGSTTQSVPAPELNSTNHEENGDTYETDENESDSDALDFNDAITATLIMKQAGYENPANILLKVAEFAVKNPEQAKMLLNQL